MDYYRPDPSLGKYRSQHEMFDGAMENVLREGKIFEHSI